MYYDTGSTAYHQKEWLKAIDNFEMSFKLYKIDLDNCRAYCEDVLYINVTGTEFGLISGDTVRKPNTLDTYTLMAKTIQFAYYSGKSI